MLLSEVALAQDRAQEALEVLEAGLKESKADPLLLGSRASLLLDRCCASGRVLAMHPNHDAGRDGIVAAIESAPVEHRAHLPRDEFVGVLRRALAAEGVVVFPGYIATDGHGRTVVLGRGGSDLTALYLAHRLGLVRGSAAARCRLIKDVDGLYERDPAAPGPVPARYATATWDDALAEIAGASAGAGVSR